MHAFSDKGCETEPLAFAADAAPIWVFLWVFHCNYVERNKLYSLAERLRRVDGGSHRTNRIPEQRYGASFCGHAQNLKNDHA